MVDKNSKVTSPRYQQIATDIASKIVEKHYQIGEKIYARSAIASQYAVSPETARRAICILSDLDIVDTTKGSGVVIKSYENALKFVQQYNDIQTVNDLKEEILDSAERQKKETEFLHTCVAKLIDRTDRFRSINPFNPLEIKISSDFQYIDKSISDINFWHNTTATIIAIKRGNNLIMSPGPHAVFTENDIFYFLGDENSFERVYKFMYPN